MKKAKILFTAILLCAGFLMFAHLAHAIAPVVTATPVAPAFVGVGSDFVPAMKLSIGTSTEQLSIFNISVADAGSSGFLTSDLNLLSTTSPTSGIAIYDNTGSDPANFDLSDQPISLSSISDWSSGSTSLTLTTSQSLASPLVYWVGFRTNSGATQGHRFVLTVPSITTDAGPTSVGTSTSAITIDNAPTVTSVSAYTDRMIINFNKNVDVMQATNCNNYRINGSILACGGSGSFIDFQSNQETIKGLNLTSGSTPTLAITGGVINDSNGNSLATYSHTFSAISAPSLPVISGISATSHAVGGVVTITGTGFGTGTAGDSNHKVFFSGGFDPSTGPKPPVEADYTGSPSWSDTSIVVKVPSGAQGGPVSVMVSGVMSDMNQNSFFDIAGDYTAHIYLSSNNATVMPDTYKDNIRIVIAGINGPVVYSRDGSSGHTMSYTAGSPSTDATHPGTFTITGVNSMGGAWAYDVTGAHLNSAQMSVNISSAQVLHLTAPAGLQTISGTISMNTPSCTTGTSKDVVVMVMPQTVDTSNTGFIPAAPAFFRTNGSCLATYHVGVPSDGIYRVEAHIPQDPSATSISSAAFTEPGALSVTVSGALVTGQNLSFTTAAYEIHGTVTRPASKGGAFSGSAGDMTQGNMLFVYAYQPRQGGKGTGTQVNPTDGTFTLYVDPGVWEVGVSGNNMPSPITTEVNVDSSYTIAAAKGPTITIAPPTDFIDGYVKDSAGNGLANVSVYAWNEGAPGGGNANTDSQGYYKMYVNPGTAYHVGANSQSYGFLGEQTGVTVSDSEQPTINFNVASNNHRITGSVTKNGHGLQQAFVSVTDGEYGQMLGNAGTDSSGDFTVRAANTSDHSWIHVGVPGQGEIYKDDLGVISSDTAVPTIAFNSATIKIQISPVDLATGTFVGVHSDANGGGFSNTAVVADGCDSSTTCNEYQIDVAEPASSTTTYYIDGNVPGYGPLPEKSLTVSSTGTFVDSDTVATGGTNGLNDGIIGYNVSGTLHTITGTVTGGDSGAWVWAGGPNGGTGAQVTGSSSPYSYTLNLKDGTYDIGVGEPNFIGNKKSVMVSGADVSTGTGLTLTAAGSTITGTIYQSNGATVAVGANVWADDGKGGFAGTTTDASGNYSLAVGSGSYTVKAAYDGYNPSNGVVVTAPATGVNITLSSAISGFKQNRKDSPITPSQGGNATDDHGNAAGIPRNAMGTGTSAGTVTIKATTNYVKKSGTNIIGNAKDISAQVGVTTVNEIPGATVSLTASKADLTADGISTLAGAKALKLSYYDPTAGTWSDTHATPVINPSTATDFAGLDATIAITFTGNTSHFSTYALTESNSSSAPGTPTALSATAGNGSAVLSWTAPTGTPAASTYDIYKKNDAGQYPFLAAVTAPTTTYTATGLTNGTTYYFEVSALDNTTPIANESAVTSAVAVTPAAPSGGGGGGGGGISYVTIVASAGTNGSISPNASTSVTYRRSQTYAITANAGYQVANVLVDGVSKGAVTSYTFSDVVADHTISATFSTATTTPTPVVTSAQPTVDLTNPDSIRAEIKRLQALVQELLSQQNGASQTAFTKILKLGSIDPEVKRLQQYLNAHGFIITKTGPGSPGNETNKFGALTKQALIKFQEKYASEILTPLGFKKGTGIFGASTRKLLNSLFTQ